jgi:hypothetical protein
VAVLLEGLVLHDGRQLVVVADQDHTFEARDAVLGALQHHGDERLHLEHLFCV